MLNTEPLGQVGGFGFPQFLLQLGVHSADFIEQIERLDLMQTLVNALLLLKMKNNSYLLRADADDVCLLLQRHLRRDDVKIIHQAAFRGHNNVAKLRTIFLDLVKVLSIRLLSLLHPINKRGN